MEAQSSGLINSQAGADDTCMPTNTRSGGRDATHAGGVVYRLNRATTPEMLLVTARVDPTVWVLPKGHIERGESPEETAVREVFEEAGVTARIVEFLTTSRPLVRGVSQHVQYFLMERLAEEEATEGRRIAWLAEAAAIRRITHESSREVLMQAFARLSGNGGNGRGTSLK